MSESRIVLRPIGKPGDLGWMVQAHGEIYAAEYGWDSSFEALVARIVADFAADPNRPGQRGWIAELDGRRAGCVLCVPADDVGDGDGATAQLRILLVDPAARGNGIGARLVDECVSFARSDGYKRMKLWTNDPLVAARRIYLSRGFALIEEQPHRSYGADLVGQIYELELQHSPGPRQPAMPPKRTNRPLCRIPLSPRACEGFVGGMSAPPIAFFAMGGAPIHRQRAEGPKLLVWLWPVRLMPGFRMVDGRGKGWPDVGQAKLGLRHLGRARIRPRSAGGARRRG